MDYKELIQKELQDHIDTLNQKEEDGEEVLSYYRAELDLFGDSKEETIAELIENADLDNTDFNIGFEQGYMRGLKVALSVFNKKQCEEKQ